jgi:hypothetical protein
LELTDAATHRGIFIHKSFLRLLTPRPADLPLTFTHSPIDDTSPIPGSPIAWIVDAVAIVHTPHGQVVIPKSVRDAIAIDVCQP